jgi:hypothetical protein
MREALGRLNAELYPPLKEIGFELRSRGPLPLPPLIQGPRRTPNGHSEKYLVQAPGDEKDKNDKDKNGKKGDKPSEKPAGGAP